MAKTKRSLNKCKNCGDTWYPRGRDISNKCPNCGSTNVTLAGPGLLTIVGALVVIGVMALANHSKDQTAPSPMAQSTVTPAAMPTDTSPPANAPEMVNDPEVTSAPQVASSSTASSPPAVVAQQASVLQNEGNFSEAATTNQASAQNNHVANNVVPSFDCAKANTDASRLICSSRALSQADVELSQVYNAAWQSAVDKQSFVKGQIDWQANVRDACKEEQCMLDAYQNRIRDLANKNSAL